MNELRTMTVGELKALLAEYPDELPVCFSYPSGDHWRTVLAGTIESAEEAHVKYTAYHEEYKVVYPEDGKEEDEGATAVLLLN
jgi:hypothetical protein